MLADKMVELEYVESLSHETVRRVLKKNEIKPWRVKGWIIPPKQSAEFVANMENVLDVYKRPFSRDYPIICMDESPKQLIKNTRLPIKMMKGKEKSVDYEYARCGVCNIFMANEPLKGHGMVKITERKTKKDWAVFIKEIADELYKDAKMITLVMDNLNTLKPRLLYEELEPKETKRIWDRFEFVFTPKHGSWLNLAEVELNVLNGQCLNRRIDNINMVKQEVEVWQDHRNNRNSVINWRFVTKDARIKLKRLYPSI